MRSLATIVFLLALFGASTQCVADCLAQPRMSPCHPHSQSKNLPAPPACQHAQLVADTHASTDVVAIAPVAAMPANSMRTPPPVEPGFTFVLPEISPPDSARLSFGILRL